MRKFLSLTLALIAFPLYAAEPPDVSVPPDVAAVGLKVKDSTVGVYVANDGGSGTVIACEGGRSLVITAKHVVTKGNNATITLGNSRYSGTVISRCRNADLALIEVKAELQPVAIREDEPKEGEEVQQWGRDWHGQGAPVYKIGKYIGPDGWTGEDGAATYTTTIDSVSGDSGCGVFDKTGRLIAVNWGAPGKGRIGQLMTGLKDMVSFLKKETLSHFPRFSAQLEKGKAQRAMNNVNAAAKCAACGDNCTCPDCKCDAPDVANRMAAGPSKPKVEYMLFVKKGCGYCDIMEAKLKKLGISYYINDNTALDVYPKLGVYENGKLKSFLVGNQSEEVLQALKK